MLSNLKSKITQSFNGISNKKAKLLIAIVACSSIGYSSMNYHALAAQLTAAEQINYEDTQTIQKLQNENILLINQNLELQQQIEDANQIVEDLKKQNTPKVEGNTPNFQNLSYDYSDAMVFEATCYGSDGGSYTADGTYCGNLGADAMFVASNDFPLGTRLYITCDSFPSINGEYIVRDRMAYSGVIDIWFGYDASYAEMSRFGRRMINVVRLS